VVSRGVLPADLAQREQLSAWEASLVASGLPLVGLDAPSRKPRMAIAAPLSAGIPGEAELVDIWLTARLPRWRVREALTDRLPAPFRLDDLYDVWLGEPALPGRVAASVYRASLPTVTAVPLAAAARTLLSAEALPRERTRGDNVVAYDLRPFIVDLEVDELPGAGACLRMTLRHDPAKGVGRPEETLAALGEALGGRTLEPAALVREGLVLADLPAPAPPAPRRPMRSSSPRSTSGPRPQPPG